MFSSHLSKQESSRPLTHDPLPRDVVEQIDVFLWSLHDNVEVVVVLKVVQHLDDVLVLDTVQEGHLFRDHLLPHLGGRREGKREGKE